MLDREWEEESALLDRICEHARKVDRVVLFNGTTFAFEIADEPTADEPIQLLPAEVAS